jgi:hypothetical protein
LLQAQREAREWRLRYEALEAEVSKLRRD